MFNRIFSSLSTKFTTLKGPNDASGVVWPLAPEFSGFSERIQLMSKRISKRSEKKGVFVTALSLRGSERAVPFIKLEIS